MIKQSILHVIWCCTLLLLLSETTILSLETNETAFANADAVVRLLATPQLIQGENRNLIFIRDVLREETIDTILLNPMKLRINVDETSGNDPSAVSAESFYSSYAVSRRNLKGEVINDGTAETTSKRSHLLDLESPESSRLKRDDLVERGDPETSNDLTWESASDEKPRQVLTVNVDPNQEEQIRNRIRKNKMMRTIRKTADSRAIRSNEMHTKDKRFPSALDQRDLKRSSYTDAGMNYGILAKKRAAASRDPDENDNDDFTNEDIYMYISAVSAFVLTSLVFMMIIALLCFMNSSKKSAKLGGYRRPMQSSSSDDDPGTKPEISESDDKISTEISTQLKSLQVIPSTYERPANGVNQLSTTNSEASTNWHKKNIDAKSSRDSLEKAIDRAANRCANLRKLNQAKFKKPEPSERNCSLSTADRKCSDALSSIETLPSLPTIKSTSTHERVSATSD